MPNPMPADAKPAWVACARRASGFTAGTLSAVPMTAWAHPGEHGHDWLMAAWHLLSEPDHLVGIFMALALGIFLARRAWVRARTRGGDSHNPPAR